MFLKPTTKPRSHLQDLREQEVHLRAQQLFYEKCLDQSWLAQQVSDELLKVSKAHLAIDHLYSSSRLAPERVAALDQSISAVQSEISAELSMSVLRLSDNDKPRSKKPRTVETTQEQRIAISAIQNAMGVGEAQAREMLGLIG